jgi:hypothetical protein
LRAFGDPVVEHVDDQDLDVGLGAVGL